MHVKGHCSVFLFLNLETWQIFEWNFSLACCRRHFAVISSNRVERKTHKEKYQQRTSFEYSCRLKFQNYNPLISQAKRIKGINNTNPAEKLSLLLLWLLNLALVTFLATLHKRMLLIKLDLCSPHVAKELTLEGFRHVGSTTL